MALIRPRNYYSGLRRVSPGVCFAKMEGGLSLIELVRAPQDTGDVSLDIRTRSLQNFGDNEWKDERSTRVRVFFKPNSFSLTSFVFFKRKQTLCAIPSVQRPRNLKIRFDASVIVFSIFYYLWFFYTNFIMFVQ